MAKLFNVSRREEIWRIHVLLMSWKMIPLNTIAEYIPCEKPGVVWYFIKNDEVATCQVTDQWKHDKGLEVPCVAVSFHHMH